METFFENPVKTSIKIAVFFLLIVAISYLWRNVESTSSAIVQERQKLDKIHKAVIIAKKQNFLAKYFVLRYKIDYDSVDYELEVPGSLYYSYREGQHVNVDTLLIKRELINEGRARYNSSSFVYVKTR